MMFSLIKSNTTVGIVRSAPVTARLFIGAEVPSCLTRARNSCTSLFARNACLSWMFIPKNFRLSIVLLLLSFPSLFSATPALPGALSCFSSNSFSSVSKPSISSLRRFFSASWASFSASNFSTSSDTACSASAVSASLMAVSSSASREANSASFARRLLSSSVFLSMLRRSMIAFNAISYSPFRRFLISARHASLFSVWARSYFPLASARCSLFRADMLVAL